MEDLTTTQLEQFLQLETEMICSIEHRDRIESRYATDDWPSITITATLTTRPA